MTEDHVCVTTTLERVNRSDRPRMCLARDRDEETGRMVAKHYANCEDATCRGCVPREATHGWLCDSCYAKVRDALKRIRELTLHLRSVDSNGQAIGERVFTSMQLRLVIPDSWIAADGFMDALGAAPIPSTATIDATFQIVADALDAWGDIDSVIATREGAKRAVVLVRRMQTALTRWPDAEVDWRRVPLILCPNCSQATLHRKGPLHYEDELTIECAQSHLMYDRALKKDAQGNVLAWELNYPYCEFSMDWFEWVDKYQRPIEAAAEIFRRGKAA